MKNCLMESGKLYKYEMNYIGDVIVPEIPADPLFRPT